ncbi:Uncharacterised protein [Shigella sonnei]|nr:Uncharacterised protein [Shigella sonnei]CSM74630.1 Uncharacterised protein [Shigella sonnei]
MRPLGDQFALNVRRVHQRVIFQRPDSGFHLVNFCADSQHRVDKAIQFHFAFRFSRFNHQRTRHRERHRRRVETVVDQALGNIQLADAGFFFQRANIENTFVRHATVATGIQHREGILQAAGNIVGVEDCHLACFFQPFCAHHADVHPADWQDRGATERCRRNCALTG